MAIRPHYEKAVLHSGLAKVLEGVDWLLAGTPPLGIDIDGSDIDVICHVTDPEVFTDRVWSAFSHCRDFRCWQWISAEKPVVARFNCADWEFEMFGASAPLEEQLAVRHFNVERRLLEHGGPQFRSTIIARKRAGEKTEPAFAAALGLDGNPYRRLLELEELDDGGLIELLDLAGFSANVRKV